MTQYPNKWNKNKGQIYKCIYLSNQELLNTLRSCAQLDKDFIFKDKQTGVLENEK